MKAKRTHIKRSARKNRGITKKILTTFAFGGTLLFASSELAKTPDKPADKDKPTLVVETQKTSISNTVESKLIAQADRYPTVAGNTPLPPELAELDKVSLSEIRKLDRDSEKYRLNKGYENEIAGKFSTDFAVNFEGGRIQILATICHVSGCNNWGTLVPPIDFGLDFFLNGNSLGTIDITELAKLYGLATGKDLRYVKLVVEKGENEHGPFVAAFVVPVDSPNGVINRNTPTWCVVYYLNEGKAYGGKKLIQ